jgi:hypothetical protein
MAHCKLEMRDRRTLIAQLWHIAVQNLMCEMALQIRPLYSNAISVTECYALQIVS